MRIVAGKYKNKPIITNLKEDDVKYRPTTEKTRSAIFNILVHSKYIEANILEDSIVADICCGSGSFGIEAISRGAKRVYFIDKDPTQIKLVKKNINSINEEKSSIFLSLDATNLTHLPEKVNIVFMDAPYALKISGKIVDSLIKNLLIDEKHIIIIEADRREDIIFPSDFEMFEERKYGRSKVMFGKINNLAN